MKTTRSSESIQILQVISCTTLISNATDSSHFQCIRKTRLLLQLLIITVSFKPTNFVHFWKLQLLRKNRRDESHDDPENLLLSWSCFPTHLFLAFHLLGFVWEMDDWPMLEREFSAFPDLALVNLGYSTGSPTCLLPLTLEINSNGKNYLSTCRQRQIYATG